MADSPQPLDSTSPSDPGSRPPEAEHPALAAFTGPESLESENTTPSALEPEASTTGVSSEAAKSEDSTTVSTEDETINAESGAVEPDAAEPDAVKDAGPDPLHGDASGSVEADQDVSEAPGALAGEATPVGDIPAEDHGTAEEAPLEDAPESPARTEALALSPETGLESHAESLPPVLAGAFAEDPWAALHHSDPSPLEAETPNWRQRALDDVDPSFLPVPSEEPTPSVSNWRSDLGVTSLEDGDSLPLGGEAVQPPAPKGVEVPPEAASSPKDEGDWRSELGLAAAHEDTLPFPSLPTPLPVGNPAATGPAAPGPIPSDHASAPAQRPGSSIPLQSREAPSPRLRSKIVPLLIFVLILVAGILPLYFITHMHSATPTDATVPLDTGSVSPLPLASVPAHPSSAPGHATSGAGAGSGTGSGTGAGEPGAFPTGSAPTGLPTNGPQGSGSSGNSGGTSSFPTGSAPTGLPTNGPQGSGDSGGGATPFPTGTAPTDLPTNGFQNPGDPGGATPFPTGTAPTDLPTG